jgi:hypothetical protein
MREIKYKLLKASSTEIQQFLFKGFMGYVVNSTCGLVQTMLLFSQRG